jgi:hypothetical protein
MGGNARPRATHCRLAKAPRIGGAENFKTKDYGLVPLAAVRTWGPLVFVRFGHVWALYWAEARRVVAKSYSQSKRLPLPLGMRCEIDNVGLVCIFECGIQSLSCHLLIESAALAPPRTDQGTDAEEEDRRLEGLHAHLQRRGFGEGMQYIASRSYVINCNWKVFVDNYLVRSLPAVHV